MSVNIGHGDQRVIDAIEAQAEKLAYANPFMAHEPRARLGREAGRADAGRHRRLLLHERRRRGERERHQARPPVHGPPEDPGALPLVSRRHRPGHRGHRRPAPLGRRDRRVPASSACPTRTAGAGPSRSRSSERSRDLEEVDHVRGPAHDRRLHPRAGRGHQRHPHPARRLPPGRARDLRPPRHPAHRRRGHERLRAHRRAGSRSTTGTSCPT